MASTYNGPVIDSHHHIWEWKNYPWLTAPISPKMYGSNYQPLRQDYLVEDLLEDFGSNTVVKSVHVQANYDPTRPVDESQWLQSVANRAGFPHAIVGDARMDAPDLEDVLAGHRAYKNVRGVRHQLHYWPGDPLRCRTDRADLCLTDKFQKGIALLEKHDLHFELQGFAHQFKHFAELAGNHPRVRFCLVHGGMLTADDAQTVREWKAGMDLLAPCKNVLIKCSGLNFFAGKCDVAHMQIMLDHIMASFGGNRAFYGSNFPLEKLWATYDDLIAGCKQIMSSHPEAEQRNFFHDTAAKFYRI